MERAESPNGIPVLVSDSRLVAVNKPSGLLSVPGRGPDKADCVVSRLASRFAWIREVHRLDQGTSGVMLLARDPEAHRFLSAAFAERRIEKIYVALTDGVPVDPDLNGVSCADGSILVMQRLDPEDRPRQVVDPDRGRPAITEWRLADPPSEAGVRRLELRPRTGRTHQIRLALALCSAPIIGDGLYGPDESAAASPRLMLHASVLRFPHPDGDRPREVVCPPEF